MYFSNETKRDKYTIFLLYTLYIIQQYILLKILITFKLQMLWQFFRDRVLFSDLKIFIPEYAKFICLYFIGKKVLL